MSVNATAAPLRELLEQLTGMSDELGVLSLYVDTGSEQGGRGGTSGGEIALRNALADLRAREREKSPRARWSAFEKRLDELESALASLVDPSLPGRGRALFAALSGGEPRSLSSRHHVGTLAVLERTPYVMPLMAVLEAEQPFGAISISGDGVRALDLAEGAAQEAAWLSFDIAVGEWRRMVGPAGANPANPHTTAAQVDLYQRRLEAHRERAVSEAVAPLVSLAEACGWTQVLVAGEPSLTEPLRDGWPQDGLPLVTADVRLVDSLSPAEVRRTAEPLLSDARRAAQAALVRRVLDGALSSASAAALGMADVLSALQEGRVQHLLIDPTARPAGALTPDGRLVPAGEVPPGVSPGELIDEPHPLERMIERALATDAEVTAVEDPARGQLADHAGVGALLRW